MNRKIVQICASALLMGMLTLSSCMKDNLSEQTPSTNAQNMNELVAPSTFEWKTSKTITVDIKGLNTVVPVKTTLSISGSGGSLYKGLHLMSESQSLTVEMPAVEKVLTLKFGSVVLTAPVENNKASFSFIPVLN